MSPVNVAQAPEVKERLQKARVFGSLQNIVIYSIFHRRVGGMLASAESYIIQEIEVDFSSVLDSMNTPFNSRCNEECIKVDRHKLCVFV